VDGAGTADGAGAGPRWPPDPCDTGAMKVTLSAAMRARDVSQPRPEDEDAARQADGAPPTGNGRARTGSGDRTERTDRGDRGGTAKSTAGRRRRRR
jgi:hypothetical protein